MPVTLDDFSELVTVPQFRMRETRGYYRASDEPLKATSEIIPPREQSFRVRRTRGRQRPAIGRAPGAVFVGKTARQECRAAGLIVPIESGPHNTSRITGEVSPAVAADITLLLPIPAAQHCSTPCRAEGRCKKSRGVGGPKCRAVHEKFANGLCGWTARNQVYDTCHRGAPVEGRCVSFNHLDLAEVNRRDL